MNSQSNASPSCGWGDGAAAAVSPRASRPEKTAQCNTEVLESNYYKRGKPTNPTTKSQIPPINHTKYRAKSMTQIRRDNAIKDIKIKRKLGFHQYDANVTGGVSSRNPPGPH